MGMQSLALSIDPAHTEPLVMPDVVAEGQQHPAAVRVTVPSSALIEASRDLGLTWLWVACTKR